MIDLRLAIVIAWLIAGSYALVGGSILLVRRWRLSRHISNLSDQIVSRVITVRITAGQERVVTVSEVNQAKVRVLKAISILAIGFVVFAQITAPDFVPQSARQWVTTLCGMTLALGLDYVIYNDLRTDARLDKSLAAAGLETETHDNGSSS